MLARTRTGSGIWSDDDEYEPLEGGLGSEEKGATDASRPWYEMKSAVKGGTLLAVAMAADLLLTLIICLRPSRRGSWLLIDDPFAGFTSFHFATSGSDLLVLGVARAVALSAAYARLKTSVCPARRIATSAFALSACFVVVKAIFCAAMRAVPGPALWFAPLWLCAEWLSMRRCIRSVTDEDDLQLAISYGNLTLVVGKDGIAQFGGQFRGRGPSGAANK